MQLFADDMKEKFVQDYLTDIGWRRDGEGVAIKGEGNWRHALDVVAVHISLQGNHDNQLKSLLSTLPDI